MFRLLKRRFGRVQSLCRRNGTREMEWLKQVWCQVKASTVHRKEHSSICCRDSFGLQRGVDLSVSPSKWVHGSRRPAELQKRIGTVLAAVGDEDDEDQDEADDDEEHMKSLGDITAQEKSQREMYALCEPCGELHL